MKNMEIYKEFSKSKEANEAREKPETKIILEIMRHAKQESCGKWDKKKRLIKEGKIQSMKKGEEVDPNARVSMAIASPRQRAQETAYRVMLANEGIDDSKINTMEDIESLISNELKVGKKMRVDERLDSINNGPIGKFYDEANDGGRFFQWAVNESDRQAIEYGDEKTLIYKRAAGNIAEIVSRYLAIGNNFNRIVSKKLDTEKINKQLERYIVTHRGVGELFLAKVLELKALELKEKNTRKRDEFLASLGEGFEYAKGFRIEIINNKNGQEVNIHYGVGKEKKIVQIDEKMLEQMIDERKEMDEIIKKSKT